MGNSAINTSDPVTMPSAVSASVLQVAGGGAGSAASGTPGGGGGGIKASTINFTAGNTYNIVVGAGGSPVGNGNGLPGSYSAVVENASTATFTGSITATTLTVSGTVTGTISAGMVLTGGTVTTNTFIYKQLTGTTGGTGTYQVSISQSSTCTGAASYVTGGGGAGSDSTATPYGGGSGGGSGYSSSATQGLSLGNYGNTGGIGHNWYGYAGLGGGGGGDVGAVFAGTISGTTLTVSSVTSGTIFPGQSLKFTPVTFTADLSSATADNLTVTGVTGYLALGMMISGSGVPFLSVITGQSTGSAGGAGTYTYKVLNTRDISSTGCVDLTGVACTSTQICPTPVITDYGTGTGSTGTYTITPTSLVTVIGSNGQGTNASVSDTASQVLGIPANQMAIQGRGGLGYNSPLLGGNVSFTGSISASTLTVTAIASGTLVVGMNVVGGGTASDTYITGQLTGTTGGTGTYSLNRVSAVSSTNKLVAGFFYTGGGGGAYSTAVGAGGTGGGGYGGATGGAGRTNTGGGGGGVASTGYSGGSGVVIISAPQAAIATTGSPTVTTVGSNTVYKFTATGTIRF